MKGSMRRRIIVACVIIFVGGAAANNLRYSGARPEREATFGTIPLTLDGWYGEERWFSDESYEVLQADTTTLRLYHDADGLPLWLFIGYFGSQKYGSQIHSPKHCLPGSGWQISSLEPYELKLPGGFDHPVNRLVISDEENRQLMLYWFETRGGVIRGEFGLKWDLMENSLLLRPTDAAMIRINLPLDRDGDVDDATAKAIAYLDDFYPSIEKALPFRN